MRTYLPTGGRPSSPHRSRALLYLALISVRPELIEHIVAMALLPVGTNHDLHMSLGFALVACREERDMFMYLVSDVYVCIT